MLSRAMTDKPSSSTDTLEQRDIELAEDAARHRNHPLVRWAGWASEIADQPQLASLCGATLLYGLLSMRPSVARTGATMLLAHLAANGIKSFIKHRVRRTRPRQAIEQGRYERHADDPRDDGGKPDGRERSFPSGHTAGAVAVASIIASRHPALAAPALALAGAVALVQLPRGKHYPSDLAAGAAVGLIGAGIAAKAMRLATRLR